jgi:hypothetical protein
MARFKIHLKTETRAVLFSVELPLAVQGRQNKKTQAYFFVYPNDIRTLTLVDSETAASCKVATQQFKGATHCLRFTLDRLGTLVMPTDKDVRANVKNEATQHALAAVLLLAARQHFVVYVSGRSANRRELLSLCCAAKDFSSSWEKPARLGVIATLYGGKGGRVISVPRERQDDDVDVDGPPPSYHDIVETPPEPADSESNKRRRQDNSSSASPTNSDKHQHQRQRQYQNTGAEQQPTISLDRAAPVENLLCRITEHIDASHARLKDHIDRRFDVIQQELSEMRERQGGTERGLNAAARKLEELDDVAAGVQSRLEDLQDGVCIQIDDEISGVRQDIIDYVQEELKPEMEQLLKEDILGNLRDQSWVLRPS